MNTVDEVKLGKAAAEHVTGFLGEPCFSWNPMNGQDAGRVTRY